jgi:sec-independent protein translocase protein TatC
MADILDRARTAARDRAELPGMSLMEHLGELRSRLLWALGFLAVGCGIAYWYKAPLTNFIQRPLLDVGLSMTMTHPTDALSFVVKTSVVFGTIFASPFILYQLWLFIAPGMYTHERRYVAPFMVITIGLFLAGAWFGYRYVLPTAIKVLVLDFGKQFTHMITIEDYTGFFLAVILGLGITFEMPVVMFFLGLFDIIHARTMLKHFRYAVLGIFLLAACICPVPDPIGMCLFASPMLALYFIGAGAAYLVRPERRKKEPLAS